MRRIFCDGCHRAGIQNDITDLPANQRRRIQVTRAQVLDLCTERCIPIFDRFDMEKQQLLASHTDEFKRRLTEVMDRFWKEVSAGAAQEERVG